MGLGHSYVTKHAIERVRLRWEGAIVLSESYLVERIIISITSAKRKVETPGGTYVPFTLLDKEGFIVIRKSRVTTVLGVECCPEVCQVLNGE